ncbi:MAG TPA: S8 family serine peptidase, partial [Symbiobacteriaceae bacterium]|nr:S8 family serine peptidase [Symbiobacteriaceae bacterium]
GLGIWGVAPEADYFAYKVLNNRGSGTYDAIAAAIRMAADNGADIISMSLGGSSAPEYVRDAIIYANGKGSLVIAAAGNSGPSVNTIGYPGAYAEAVAVAALEMISGTTGSGDSTSLSNLRVSSYSSRGIGTSSGADGIQDREVEIGGPGSYVESTSNSGGYVKYSGTSMATPHMAGLAAKMWQGSAASTRSWLVSQAQRYDITQANGGGAATGYDYASGYGGPRVN